jgi:hypothetical protein
MAEVITIGLDIGSQEYSDRNNIHPSPPKKFQNNRGSSSSARRRWQVNIAPVPRYRYMGPGRNHDLRDS